MTTDRFWTAGIILALAFVLAFVFSAATAAAQEPSSTWECGRRSPRSCDMLIAATGLA